MNFFYKIVLCALFFASINSKAEIIEKDGQKYLANSIVVKFKSFQTIESFNTGSLQKGTSNKLKIFGIDKVSPIFNMEKNVLNKSESELHKIASVEFSYPYDPVYIAKKIDMLDEVEWAEPNYIFDLAYEVDDPKYTDRTQWFLNKIKASEAWDVSQGSEEVVIAIIDTGVDWDHPDLAANIWVNENEIAGNGIDDDNNGYIDDVRGWDFGGLDGTADNNPMEDRPDHGTHVAGLASGVTNNGIGIASIGFNCKIMPVKVSRDDVRNENNKALVTYGYQGIKYAVDNGAKIINCSWGGSGYSNFGNSVIEYAISKDVLVVGAAGNDNEESIIYPAAYEGALSVGATNDDDRKSSFSNYGLHLDVMSPGSNIYGTWQNDRYISIQGTSMAAPIAAGLAGLVASAFPEFNALQIAEQIRVNTDDIYSMNSFYDKKLGAGRINAHKALSNSESISVRAENILIVDEVDDNILSPGESLNLEMKLKNYLSPTSNLVVSLSSENSSINIIKNSLTVGSLNTLEEYTIPKDAFLITINNEVPTNEVVNILLEYTDGDYKDFQWISLLVNPSYKTQNGENVTLTITSKGTLAYNDFPDNNLGEGFSYKENGSVMFEGALMYGTSVENLMDGARAEDMQSEDFVIDLPISITTESGVSDYEGYTRFLDVNNKIKTHLYSYSFSSDPNGNYLILKYIFENISTEDIDNFRAGLFYDLDIGSSDIVEYDSKDNIGYSYSSEDPDFPYYGSALISDNSYSFYAINNGDNDTSKIEIYNDFSKKDKWKTLSSGLTNTSSGPSDASMVVSGGPYQIPVSDSITVAFVVAAGDDLEHLRKSIKQSRVTYSEIVTNTKDIKELPSEFSLKQNYPNPFNPSTTIEYTIPAGVGTLRATSVHLIIYDVLGKKVKTIVDENQKPGYYKIAFDATDLASGIYFYHLKSGSFTDVKKMMLLK